MKNAGQIRNTIYNVVHLIDCLIFGGPPLFAKNGSPVLRGGPGFSVPGFI